ncbi:hypothetical protein CVT25_009806 [Psilocybe cyanescens]|uniref:Clp1-like protein n=1 Tax=Psilocybe cyanescens TaxID=93625 RepID=A0A409X856_PSICY|nr:hypothetical protein CVT25_009806 [Psilocybe cyanescens]
MIARLHNNKANKVAFTSASVQCHSSSTSSRLSSIRRPQINRRRRASLFKLARYCPATLAIPTAAATMKVKPAPAPTSRINLPARLTRPAFKEIDAAALRKACPELGDMPLSYTREGLKHMSTHMYAGVQGAVPQHSKSQLPHELQVMLSDPISHGSICPTHILAITSSAPLKAGTPRKVALFAAHQLVLSANCSRLPVFPSSATAVPMPRSSGTASNEVTMPVVRLALPAPDHFAPLMWYLYMKNPVALRRALLPTNWSADVASVMGRVRAVHGIWANACALGVVDAPLYDALEEAWQHILRALALATAAPSS